MIAQLRAASDLLSRMGFARRAGKTYAGARDLYDVLGYKWDLTAQDYRQRYARGGIAARIVEALPKATWRGGLELVEDEDPTVSTPFEEEWQALEKRIKVWANMSKVDVLAGLGRYAVLLIGAPGALETELPARLAPDDIAYLRPFSEEDAEVIALDDDLESPRYGEPVTYNLKRSTIVSGNRKDIVRRTHWSRLLHIADETLDDSVFGTPRLERIWNYLDDLDKVAGGGAEAFWRRAHQGMIMSIDKDTEMSPEDAQKTRDAMDEMIHDLRRAMVTRAGEVTQLGSDVANFSNPVDAIITLISGATGIPKRILVGSERGELASTQDRENWEQKVSDRRVDFAEPVMVRPFVDLLIERGALPQPEMDEGQDYDVRWPEIESLTEPEQAEMAERWSKLNAQAKSVVVTAAEIRDRVLRLEPLDDADRQAEEETIVKATPAPLIPGQPDPNADPNAEPGEPAPGKAPALPVAARAAGRPFRVLPTATARGSES